MCNRVFPTRVVQRMEQGLEVEPESHECVTVFFCDIVGYTDLAAKLDAVQVSWTEAGMQETAECKSRMIVRRRTVAVVSIVLLVLHSSVDEWLTVMVRGVANLGRGRCELSNEGSSCCATNPALFAWNCSGLVVVVVCKRPWTLFAAQTPEWLILNLFYYLESTEGDSLIK